jgi:phosphoadenylyl-sulfate reductase (thioredoxin)
VGSWFEEARAVEQGGASTGQADTAAQPSASVGDGSTPEPLAGQSPGAVLDAALDEARARLEGASPSEILRWADERFAPRLVFATGFGPEGLVVLDLIARHRLRVDVFTLDTGLLFPETEALWKALEQKYGLLIRAVRPALSLDEQAARHGGALWQREPDRCCAIRKLEPLREALAGQLAWISAIRADQTRDRAAARVVERDERYGLVKVNPLLGWTSDEVWSYLREHDVETNPLHQQGYPSIGCWPCTSPVAPGEDPRAGRWRGRAKTECGLHSRPAGPVSPIPTVRTEGAR